MPQFGKWVLTLGLVAATPAVVTAANPFARLFRSQSAAPRTNQQVATDIAAALRSARLNRYAMDIEFDKGVCKLMGKVATAEQRALATKVVSSVKGVQSVDNKLQVMSAKKPAPRGPFSRLNTVVTKDSRGVRRAEYSAEPMPRRNVELTGGSQSAQPSNQQMAERIAKSLQSAGMTGYDMEIRYQNGVASLGGSVASPQQRLQAGQIVQGVPGVTAVNNMLTVTAPSGAQPMPRQAMTRRPMPRQAMLRQAMQPMPRQAIRRAAMYQTAPGPAAPQAYTHGGPGARNVMYSTANLPEYAWPAYANYPNYAQLTYPKQYSASAWPYIGPFYPYPQVPLGWRKATLEWDDGYWNLSFNSRTDRWWWFLNPTNW